MFVRNLKIFTNNNLCLQRSLALNIYENKSIRSLSTSVYLSNKYDDLYKERYATFKCKFEILLLDLIESGHSLNQYDIFFFNIKFFILFWEKHVDIFSEVFRERISYKFLTKSKRDFYQQMFCFLFCFISFHS